MGGMMRWIVTAVVVLGGLGGACRVEPSAGPEEWQGFEPALPPEPTQVTGRAQAQATTPEPTPPEQAAAPEPTPPPEPAPPTEPTPIPADDGVQWSDDDDDIDADGGFDAEPCCKVCHKGKACGDACIARNRTCTTGPGCACNG